jgi:NAD(P)-dependent dehydrogenase (short-subunit alcohol dehydrogenase family)
MKKKKNIIIIGASSSVGNEIISRFNSPSTRIIATYNSKQTYKQKENLTSLKLDLNNNESIENFINELKSIVSHIDTAIFLAGILPGKNLKEYILKDIEEVMTINFTGQAKVIKGLLPLFDCDSHILMISSISAQRGSYDPIYAASKGAVLSFVKSIATGLGGTRVNAIAPGLIEDSAMFNEMSIERREFHRQQKSNKQLLQISDFSRIIFDLSRNHWKHLNGACIDLNAGQYVR